MAEIKPLPKAATKLPKPDLTNKQLTETVKTSNPDEQDALNRRLYDAAKYNRIGDIKKLLDQGADTNAIFFTNLTTSLIWAARNGQTEICKLLIEKGANMEAKDNDGMTALMWTVQNGFIETCKLLIEKGADIEATSFNRVTVLMRAALKGQTEICKLLIEEGANIWATDDSNRTALVFVNRTLNKETFTFLSFETFAPIIFRENADKDSFYSNFKECVK